MNFSPCIFIRRQFPVAVGNLIADQVKGNEIQHFPLEVQKGIYLHRAIDEFTDAHPYLKIASQPFSRYTDTTAG